MCEAYGQLVLLDADDLKFNIEKIRELTSRSCSAKQVRPAGGELKSDLGRKDAWEHTVIRAGIHNGIAAEIASTVDERDA